MKRYRVFLLDFDVRANTLTIEIQEDWEEEVKALHRHNKQAIEQSLVDEFGGRGSEIKRKNFVDIGDKPLSILAFHNNFFQQIRNAFIVGAYYPALTGACALGERILNYLLLVLRNDFKGTDAYKRVYKKQSFDDWDLAIDTLDGWGVLLSDVAREFRQLKDARHRAIHFRPEVDRDDRDLALDAIKHLRAIIASQFVAFGTAPWFIPNMPGESFIKKGYETDPFIKRVFLPSCSLVGPEHEIVQVVPKFVVNDDFDYEDRGVTDEEFAALRATWREKLRN